MIRTVVIFLFLMTNFVLSAGVVFCQDKNRTLVGAKPVVVAGSTPPKFQLDLKAGCEYTISSWFWLWKQKYPPGVVLPVFSSRSAVKNPKDPKADQALPFIANNLNPSMLFNGFMAEKYFFSVSRDVYNNYADGFWSIADVRYHEWLHITFIILSSSFHVYINGEHQGMGFVSGHVDVEPFDFNNTVFYVGGAEHGRSASAMFQDFHIFSGRSSLQNTRIYMNMRPPPKSRMLNKLLREYGLYSLEGFTPLDYIGGYYGEIEWGLCPIMVCGKTCIDESFFFTTTTTDAKQEDPITYGIVDEESILNGLNDVAYEEYIRIADHLDNAPNIVKDPPPFTLKDPTDRIVLKSLAMRLKDIVLKQLDILELDPYGDDAYLDFYVDEELVGADQLFMEDLEKLSDSELEAVNMWVESSIAGYEMNIDEYLDIVQSSDVDLQGDVAEIVNSGDDEFEVKNDGSINVAIKDTSPLLVSGRASTPRKNSKSILPRRPQWKSRFLGKKMVVLDSEEAPKIFSFKDLIKKRSPVYKFLQTTFGHLFTATESSSSNVEYGTEEYLGLENGNIDYYEIYKSLHPEIDESVIKVQELYDSALLWLHGRHLEFSSHAAMGLEQWVQSSHEASEAALFFAHWLAFDNQLENKHRSQKISDFLFVDPIAQPIHLALGFRAGFESHNLTEWTYLYCEVGTVKRPEDVTNHNTGYLRHLMGYEYSTTETDTSLNYALGGVSLHEILFGATKNANRLDISTADDACQASLAYYFPVAKYTVKYFGKIETGVGKPEELRLANGLSPLELYEGDDALLHEVNFVEANNGNVEAQIWMAMRYFWGYGGVQPNLAAARRLIELAAGANHPEGLYNLGVLHDNGRAGYAVNHELALRYFRAAADHPHPFNMAVHVMGNHYLAGSAQEGANITLAVAYYVKAILLGSADACYSLATLLRDKDYVSNPNFRLALFLYAKGANSGHVHSVYALAQAFGDPDSWLAEHLRAERVRQIGDSVAEYLLPPSKSHGPKYTIAELLSTENLADLNYDSSSDIIVRLPGAVDYIVLPNALSCRTALPFLKFLAEHSYRIRDVARAGYEAFINGDLWSALDYYDEAADLGSAAAQENAAFIYDILLQSECNVQNSTKTAFWKKSLNEFIFKLLLSLKLILEGAKKLFIDCFGSSVNSGADGKASETAGGEHSYLPNLEGDACSLYYKRMAALRRLQSASNNEPSSIRMVANDILTGEYPFSANQTRSALLFGRAAELGDVHSIMSLGWMFFYGSEDIAANTSISARLFTTAGMWEVLGSTALEYSPDSTGGLAPSMAWLFVSVCDVYSNLIVVDETGNVSFISSMKQLFHSFPKELNATSCLVLSVCLFCYTFVMILIRRAMHARQ